MAEEPKKYQVEEEDGTTVEAVPLTYAQELQKQLDEAKGALAKEQDKEKNFNNLRKSKEADEGKIEELSKNINDLSSKLNSVLEGTAKALSAYKESTHKKIAGEDAELAKKIDYFYGQFQGDPKTPEEIEQRSRQAYVLATADRPNATPFEIAVSARGTGSVPKSNTDFSDTEAGKEIAKRYGIVIEEPKK